MDKIETFKYYIILCITINTMEAYKKMEQSEEQFEADLGIWQCFGGKDIMLERQKKILEDLRNE